MRTTSMLALLASMTALGACAESNGGEGGQSTTSTGGTTTTTTTTDTTSTTDATTTDTTSTTTSATTTSTSPSCTAAGGGLSVAARTPEGDVYDCSESIPGLPFHAAVDGVVTASETGGLVVDTCAEGAACTSSAYTFAFPFNAIPKGTFVHVEFDFDYWVDCTSGITVSNLPSWAGQTNPASEASFDWFSGGDWRGAPPDLEGIDYSITSEKVLCDYSPADQTGVYDYRFFETAKPQNAVVVPVGEQGEIHVERDGAPFVLTLHNLQAGCVTCPSDGSTFALAVTQAPE